jgi:hypothetical protein
MVQMVLKALTAPRALMAIMLMALNGHSANGSNGNYTNAAIGISTNGHNRIDGDAVANSGFFLIECGNESLKLPWRGVGP